MRRYRETSYAQALELLEEGFAGVVAEGVAGVSLREACLLRAWCLLRLRRYDECLEGLAEAKRLGWLAGDDAEATLIGLWIDLVEGRYESIMPTCQHYIDRHRHSPDRLLAEYLLLHAFTATRVGQVDTAVRSSELAAALFHLLEMVQEEIEARNLWGNAAAQMSRFRQALRMYRHCLRLNRSLPDTHRRIYLLLNIGIVQSKVGDLAAARRSLTAARRLAEKNRRFRLERCRTLLALGRIDGMTGDIAAARRLLTEAYAEAQSLHASREECLALEFLGDTVLHEGKASPALRYFERGLAIARHISPEGDLVMELQRRIGQARSLAGDHAAADRAFQESERLCQAHGDHYEHGVLLRCRSASYRYQGRLEEARQLAERAVAELAGIGARFELALAHENHAECLLALLEAGNAETSDGPPPLPEERLDTARTALLAAHHLWHSLDLDSGRERTRRQLAVVEEMRKGTPSVLARRRHAPHIIAASRAMKQVLDLCDRYARQDLPVLILGETGTGKELIARRLHDASARSQQPLVSVNCAAIPAELFERELFGHARGAYTGATTDSPGLIDRAAGGTLFLDEIGELSLDMQVKLLRLLEDGSYYRLGDPTPRHADVRIVAATNADLEEMVHRRRFRADLFYRLSWLTIRIPPLRKRRADVIPLLAHYYRQFSRSDRELETVLSPEQRAVLRRRPWPGNVREVQQEALNLALRVGGGGAPGERERQNPRGPGRNEILEMVAMCGGNRSEAARRLGISRSTLYRKLQN